VTSERDTPEAAVDRVFVALGRMNELDLVAMNAAWASGDTELRERAWSKVQAKLRRDPRSRILGEARDRLSTWVSQSYITWRAGANTTQVFVRGGMDQADLRRGAELPVLDAVAAMLVDEVLDDDEREMLLEPLRLVTQPKSTT